MTVKNLNHFPAFRRLFVGFISVFCIVGLSTMPVRADTPISQSYTADKSISIGSIVSLKPNTSDEIELATIENTENIFGITINADSSLITIKGKTGTQVQVATQGTASVLVSDINGAIKRGDSITASPIKGVGMKATNNIRIVGIAQNDASQGTKQNYKDSSGKEQSVNVTQIPVLVNVAYFYKQPEKSLIPSALQNIANGIAGKKVDTLPVLIGAGIFIITLITVVSIIYSMVRNGIISVGRNPMSQSAIYRDLLQLSALVLGILSVGMVSIYLVLTKL